MVNPEARGMGGTLRATWQQALGATSRETKAKLGRESQLLVCTGEQVLPQSTVAAPPLSSSNPQTLEAPGRKGMTWEEGLRPYPSGS